MKKNLDVKMMTEIAILAAIGWILDFLASAYSKAFWPNGGSIGIALVCVFIISYRHGTLAGVITGTIMAVLDLLDGFYAISDEWYKVFMQLALDYILAYPVAGLAGLFRPLVNRAKNIKISSLWMILGCAVGGTLKFLCHYFSGVIFWSSSFDETKYLNEWTYSFWYNAPYVYGSIILSVVILIIINIKAPQLINPTVVETEE